MERLRANWRPLLSLAVLVLIAVGEAGKLLKIEHWAEIFTPPAVFTFCVAVGLQVKAWLTPSNAPKSEPPEKS